MSVKIKICGLSRMEDIEAVNGFVPDYIGFVFAQMSKRYVSPTQAETLAGKVRPEIKKVGVFVNEEIPFIMELAEKGIIDVVQLHGQEDENYIEQLRQAWRKGKRSRQIVEAGGSRIDGSGIGGSGIGGRGISGSGADDIPIIQAYSMATFQDVKKAMASTADLILLDKGKGGTGTAFDWTLANQVSRPFFLAGGLDEENVAEAIACTSPYGVDLSSGAETNGVKDRKKIEHIIRRIRDGKGQIRSPRRTVYTGNVDE